MIKFNQKHFILWILFEKYNPDWIKSNQQNYNFINCIENKLTRFQICLEKGVACNYLTPLCKTEYSEILVEYEKRFGMKTGKLSIDPAHPYQNQ